MSEVNNQAVTPEAATPAPASTPAPVEEIVYAYQPKDLLGRPLGGPQVFKGKTQQEIFDKIAESNVNLIRLNRDLTKKIRLGEVEQENIPDSIERIQDEVEFNPRSFTPEERINISRDMLDPEKVDEASDKVIEAKFGARPEVVVGQLNQLREELRAMKVLQEAQKFMEAVPEYYPCKENKDTIVSWMLKNNLAPTKDNFVFAYNELNGVGLLLEAPIVREEAVTPEPTAQAEPTIQANTQPELEVDNRIIDREPAQPQRPTPKAASGLTRAHTSSPIVTPTAPSGKLTLAELNKMSGDEYGRRLKDPVFAKQVNELYASLNKRN